MASAIAAFFDQERSYKDVVQSSSAVLATSKVSAGKLPKLLQD
jgi:hypothetical protein